jgi:hypothetical protein
MITNSFEVKDASQLEDKLLSFFKNNYKPTIGFVFCSPNHDIDSISKIFSMFEVDILGSTTAGEIANQNLSEGSIVCMLMDIPKTAVKPFFIRNTEGVYETAQAVRAFAENSYTNPAIIVCSAGIFNDGEEIVAGLKHNAKREIPIFGGLAGDDLAITETIVFNSAQSSNNGMAAFVFDNDKIEVKGLATSGWEPLGTFNTVTKAEGNKIYTINNEPALDFFIRFFGEYENISVENKNLSTVSAQYPLQVSKNTDYTVLRSPIQGDIETRSLTLVGSIKEGDKFRFSISPGVEVIEKTINEFEHYKHISNDVDALILFSCKGRHAALGPFMDDEIEGIYNTWKKPMIGFLTYGEIGNLNNGVCEFHNETCCLVTFKEK